MRQRYVDRLPNKQSHPSRPSINIQNKNNQEGKLINWYRRLTQVQQQSLRCMFM